MINTTNIPPLYEALPLRFEEDGILKIRSNQDESVYDVGIYHTINKHQLIYQMENGRQDENIVDDSEALIGDSQRDEVGGNTRNVAPSGRIALMGGALRSVMGSSKNDIISFLKKPMIVTQGNLTVADGPATFTVKGLFAGLDNPIRADKLRGVYSIRADTIITIEVNANPFQSGRYILASIPTGGGAHPGTGMSTWINMHRFSKT
jgi:hypothetical protein